MFQLTQDDRIKNGHNGCSKEELKIHSINARLKQYIGNEHIKVHSNRVNVHDNDMFLLTTDGILDPVSRVEIAEIITEEKFEDIPDKLVNRANHPILVPLFYSKYNPETYQKEGSPKNSDYKGFGKFVFVPQDCPSVQRNDKTPKVDHILYIDKGDCPSDGILEHKKIIYIYREDETKAFRIVYD